jgi:hypothetical protein
MYLWGAEASGSPLLTEAGSDFITFAGMHLMSTMFIAADEPGGVPGVCHRILDPMGHGDLLARVDRILDSPVGVTTLREYLWSKRNCLALRGTLRWSSQPSEVQDVNGDEVALGQYSAAMGELEDAVADLDEELPQLDAS